MSDPILKELQDIAAQYCDGPVNDDIDAWRAIYWYCANWHGGQSSNLYSVLSTAPYNPGRLENGVESGDMSGIIYDSLESEFNK